MKNKLYLLVALIVTGSMLLISCVSENEKENKEDNIKIEDSVSKNDVEEEKVELPEESQQVTELPWDDDKELKQAQEENNTDVLIAGFCTVLEESTPEEISNVELAVNTVTGTIIAPEQVFSQNDAIGPYTEERGYKEGAGYAGDTIVKTMGGGICKVATALYNTAVVSDLEITERHNHSMSVPYAQYGQDAAIVFGVQDLKFKNNTKNNILIWTKLIDNRIYTGFYGKEKAPQVKWEHEVLNETKPTTDYKVNPELEDGEENILVEGRDGKEVNSSVIVKYKDGNEEIKQLGESFYLPLTKLIEKNK